MSVDLGAGSRSAYPVNNFIPSAIGYLFLLRVHAESEDRRMYADPALILHGLSLFILTIFMLEVCKLV